MGKNLADGILIGADFGQIIVKVKVNGETLFPELIAGIANRIFNQADDIQ